MNGIHYILTRTQSPMLLNQEDRQKRNLEHARWRVKLVTYLLDCHRRTPGRQSMTWQQREAEYESELAAAREELERLGGFESLRWREESSSLCTEPG